MNNTVCMLLITFLCCGSVMAQDKIYPVAQEMPTLKGCEDIADLQERHNCTQQKLKSLLADNLRYPEEAKTAGKEGHAIVSFVVTAKGGLDDVQVVEDPGYGMGEAALKAVKKMNKHWVAGMNKGEKVSVRMNVPVMFKLPEEKEEAKPEPDVFKVVDQMPTFAGCEDKEGQEASTCTFEKLTRFMIDNLKYPKEAKEAGVEGTVITEFVIDREGRVTNAIVTQSLSKECDAEALRILGSMPAWSPGKHQGKTVKVQMALPVRFMMGKG
ncbi:MAG: energy transducer TonB [Saprospiraceae bacterium]|nr:energy transducer TonB [Saprospiraceae bacterium]